jgi:hypothetical protein
VAEDVDLSVDGESVPHVGVEQGSERKGTPPASVGNPLVVEAGPCRLGEVVEGRRLDEVRGVELERGLAMIGRGHGEAAISLTAVNGGRSAGVVRVIGGLAVGVVDTDVDARRVLVKGRKIEM